MSLLLEALQKSARQRQLGTPLTLDEGISRPLPARRAPRWNLWLAAAAGIAILFAVRGWFGERGESGPISLQPGAEPRAQAASGRDVQKAPAADAEKTAYQSDVARSGAARPDAISNEAASGGRSRDVSPSYDEYTRPAARAAATPAAEPAAPGKKVDPLNLDYLTTERLNQPAGAGRETADPPPRSLPVMPPLPEAGQPGAGPDLEPGDEAGAEPPAAHSPPPTAGPLGYDDLPPAIRRELPALKITISVYDDDPDKRFVLIDHQRFRIGDDLVPGVRLNDIRRDGLVLEFRDYLFVWRQR